MDCSIIVTALQPVLLVAAGVTGALIVYLLTRSRALPPALQAGSDRALARIDAALRTRLGEWWPVVIGVGFVTSLSLIFMSSGAQVAAGATKRATDWRAQLPLYLLIYIVIVMIVANATTIFLDSQQDEMTSMYIQLQTRGLINPDKSTRYRNTIMAVVGLVVLGVLLTAFYWWYQIHGLSLSI